MNLLSKTYFKMSINSEQKFRMCIRTYYVQTQIFLEKLNIFHVSYKKGNFGLEHMIIYRHIFVFFTDAI
jgi:hypothetical protein